ncbi:hypothetical protein FRC16_003547 [Serendipita sp. 398]|nr:hypothetical protein FRC16_003547 [Serendipita sp. 398]
MSTTNNDSTETLHKQKTLINVPEAGNESISQVHDHDAKTSTEGERHILGNVTKEEGATDNGDVDTSNDPVAAAGVDRDLAVRVWVASANRDDEVRDALGRMIARVDELAQLLRNALKAQTDLENTLTVTRSNLALALSNNEMLEEALKRDASGRRVDVGWNRSTGTPSPMSGTPMHYQHSPQPPLQKGETGFFKFLRGNNSVSSPRHMQSDSTGSARLHTPNSSIDGAAPPSSAFSRAQSGLMSPSMPSLHVTSPTASNARREEELAHALQKERASTSKALMEKQKLEEELESLSQALFEEANRMVSTERRQRAQVEEELQIVRQEREALKGALRIVEGENATLRSGGPVPPVAAAAPIAKERSRGLTINTERQPLPSGQLHEEIQATQTPPTSELPNIKANTEHHIHVHPLGSASQSAPEGGVNPWESPNDQANRQLPGQTSDKPKSRTSDHNPRGHLTFGI